MFRKLVIFLVMLVHINGSMFLPQVAELDVYNAQGMQEDDINTVVEYVDEVIIGNHDTSPEDEDNDQGQNFHLVKLVEYCYQVDLIPIKHRPAVASAKTVFSLFREEKPAAVILDTPAPPPKA